MQYGDTCADNEINEQLVHCEDHLVCLTTRDLDHVHGTLLRNVNINLHGLERCLILCIFIYRRTKKGTQVSPVGKVYLSDAESHKHANPEHMLRE